MKEFKTDKAIIRIHGNPNREKVEDATINFLKKVQKRKKVTANGGSNADFERPC